MTTEAGFLINDIDIIEKQSEWSEESSINEFRTTSKGTLKKSSQSAVSISIVIPAYNEENRLPSTLKTLRNYLNDRGWSAEIIVVDDGSTDATVDIALSCLNTSIHKKVISNKYNQGKGSAIRQGMLEAKGEYVLFMDADMSTPIQELDSFLTHLSDGYDVVIGSRKIKGAIIDKHQPSYREILGKAFSWLSRLLTVRWINDFTCGFKCFRKACISKVFGRQRLKGWGYDTEILFIASKHGLMIKEVPVSWSDSAESKVRIWKDAMNSALDLMKIRLNYHLGYYR